MPRVTFFKSVCALVLSVAILTPSALAAGETAPTSAWVDYDGDGVDDLVFLIPEVGLRLLRNAGEGRFEEVTALVGLGELGEVRAMSWADADGDADLDLALVCSPGELSLFLNEGGALFVRTGVGSDLQSLRDVQSATWHDIDADARPDLLVQTRSGYALHRNLGGGRFEPALVDGVRTELGSPGGAAQWTVQTADPRDDVDDAERTNAAPGTPASVKVLAGRRGQFDEAGRSAGEPRSPVPMKSLPNSLVEGLGTPGTLSKWVGNQNLGDSVIVESGGRIGIGTNAPSSALEVAGTIRASGTDAALACYNPSNGAASVKLDWLSDVARIRVGGSGAGATSGLDVQTTGDNSLMRILHNGNVGIDTTSPAVRLQVSGGSDATSTSGGYVQLGSSTGENLALDPNEIMARSNGAPSDLNLNLEGGIVNVGDDVNLVGASRKLTFTEASTLAASLFYDGDGLGGSANRVHLRTEIPSIAKNVMTWELSGDVGIGTETPEFPLHIVGGSDITASGGGFIQVGSTNNANIAIDSNEIMARDGGGVAPLNLNVEGGNIIMGTDGVVGRVGIGENGPTDRLHVSANAGESALRIQADGTTRLRVHANGGVSIGSNNSSVAAGSLTVAGDVSADSFTIPPTTRWLTLTGADFVGPGDKVTAGFSLKVVLDGNNLSSPNEYAAVHLPHGATVIAMTVVASDASPTGNMQVELRRQDVIPGSWSGMASVSTSGSAGQQVLADTTISSSTIDNVNYGYYIYANAPYDPGAVYTISTVRISYRVSELGS